MGPPNSFFGFGAATAFLEAILLLGLLLRTTGLLSTSLSLASTAKTGGLICFVADVLRRVGEVALLRGVVPDLAAVLRGLLLLLALTRGRGFDFSALSFAEAEAAGVLRLVGDAEALPPRLLGLRRVEGVDSTSSSEIIRERRGVLP